MALKIKLVGGLLLAAFLLGVIANYNETRTPITIGSNRVVVGDTEVQVEVVDTPAARAQGLSERAGLAEGHGMLFVFEGEGTPGIWMKDMHFPIDIIWANREGEIVTIAHSVAPETYPESFYPTAPALYVLEVPAGFAQKHGIAEGDKIVVQ